MKIFISLAPSKLLYFIACLCFSFVVSAQETTPDLVVTEPIWKENLKKIWEEDIQFHGFLSQGLFHTTGNNVYGQSKNSVSAGLTEIGLNVSYQALDNLSFAVQGLYRRAGASTGDAGKLSLDFAFFDYTFFRHNNGRFGIRGGRVKNPWGLYNETRDVSFTHPTIFLPLVYFDRSRTLFLAMDGGQFYTDYNTPIGDLTFKFNYGLMNANDKDLLTAILIDPDVSGNLQSKPSLVTQLNYEAMGGQYILAISYANIEIDYQTLNALYDPYTGFEVHMDTFMVSAQYNGEKFSMTGEYSMQWSAFTGLAQIPDRFPVSEHWYVQAGYRILDNLKLTVRYDSTVQDINDRSGEQFQQITGLPAHLTFTQDFVFGLRWDITPSWMIRGEYHRVHGASSISLLDNPDFSDAALDWNIYALQVSYRF